LNQKVWKKSGGSKLKTVGKKKVKEWVPPPESGCNWQEQTVKKTQKTKKSPLTKRGRGN